MTKWYNGAPPSIGWWPASMARDIACIRWWDGKGWSLACYSDDTANGAAKRAKIRSPDSNSIQWTNRPNNWPERSRT